MYLDFDYYVNNGGKIQDESTFNIYNKKAQILLDTITYKRLMKDITISDTVKMCLIELVDSLKSQNSTQNSFTHEGAIVTSMSNAGMGLTFKVDDESSNVSNLQNNISIINMYLGNEFNEKGELLLYRGDYN